MEHLLDGILFGMGFALVNIPLELLMVKLVGKKTRVKKPPILKLVKNIK